MPTTLLTDTEVTSAEWDGGRYRLQLRHAQVDREYVRETASLVLATGYAAQTPPFLAPIADRLDHDVLGRLAVARDYSVDGGRGRVFVQNGEEHTHGLTAPDLGFGAWRNSSILASITAHESSESLVQERLLRLSLPTTIQTSSTTHTVAWP